MKIAAHPAMDHRAPGRGSPRGEWLCLDALVCGLSHSWGLPDVTASSLAHPPTTCPTARPDRPSIVARSCHRSHIRPEMRPIIRALALVTALWTIAAPDIAAAQRPPRATAIVNVNVLPMDTERVLARQTVLIENGRIARLGSVAQVAVPRGAVVIDGTGKYLVPGLADLHVHLSYNPVEHHPHLLKLFL